jgi:hypothetical protein
VSRPTHLDGQASALWSKALDETPRDGVRRLGAEIDRDYRAAAWADNGKADGMARRRRMVWR